MYIFFQIIKNILELRLKNPMQDGKNLIPKKYKEKGLEVYK